jgi:hypothetical protein
MKKILLLLTLSFTLFADDNEAFFKASKENFLLCRAGYETYVMISSNNASIVTINKTKYFRYKNEDYYFPLSGCNTVKEHDAGLIF